MENAVDALKIAFAVFVFTMALGLAIYMFTEARITSDAVLQTSDVTEYMQYVESENIENEDRIVGLETIVPTLYKYYKENYTVIFKNSDGSPLELYETQTNTNLWSAGYINKYYNNNTDLRICSFDVDEETRRHEPWTGNTDYYKQNIDMFLSGGVFYYPNGNGQSYDYSRIIGRGGFLEKYKDEQFRESIGEYIYNEVTADGDQSASGRTEVQRKKRVIIYTLL